MNIARSSVKKRTETKRRKRGRRRRKRRQEEDGGKDEGQKNLPVVTVLFLKLNIPRLLPIRHFITFFHFQYDNIFLEYATEHFS